jgi:hypothetical protein
MREKELKVTILFFTLASILNAGGNVLPAVEEVVEEEVVIDNSSSGGDSSVGVFVGSEGVGATYSKKMGIMPKGVMKFSVSGLTGVNKEYESDGVTYDGDINLLNLGVTFDYHPFNNGFYLSSGGFYNGNKINFKASPTNGSYTINGHTYSTDELGYLKGETNFQSFVPYVGLGYDNSLFGSGNWFFTAKAGVIYQGSPDVKLDYHCGNSATDAVCHEIKKDAKEAEGLLNKEIEDYNLYPDLAVGISYRF